MAENRVLTTHSLHQLANGLQENHALDISHSSTHFDKAHVRLVAIVVNGQVGHALDPVLEKMEKEMGKYLDLVRSMGNNLHSLSEVVSSAFLLNDTLIYLSGGDVVISSQFYIQKSLIITEIKIDLASVSKHVHLSMFIGAHCTSIAILQHNHDETTRY